MATLVLKEFRCVEESDEVGSDSPYFIVFVGHPINQTTSNVYHIEKKSWGNDTDTGELKSPNIVIERNINSLNTLVLVGLMERDDGNDVDSEEIKYEMAYKFNSFVGPSGASANALAEPMRDILRDALRDHIAGQFDNDDLLGTRHLKITTLSGLLPLLDFTGDGSRYRVRFEMRPD